MTFAPPGGYLTPTSSQNPHVSVDVTSNAIWWTPKCNVMPYHDGTEIVMASPGQLRLDLVAQHAADNLYNVAVIRNPSTGLPMLATTAAWSNSGFGTSAAGADVVFNTDANLASPPAVPTWFPVNHTERVFRNGSDTFTVPIGRAILLGTIRPRSNGIVGCDCSGGTDRRWDIDNYWNERQIELRVVDTVVNPPEDNWTYSAVHPQYANANSANRASIVSGVTEKIEAEYYQCVYVNNCNNIITGIQFNDETYVTGQWPNQPYPGQTQNGALKFSGLLGTNGGGSDRTGVVTSLAQATVRTALGLNKFTMLHWVESFNPALGAATMFAWSREYSMLMRVKFWG